MKRPQIQLTTRNIIIMLFMGFTLNSYSYVDIGIGVGARSLMGDRNYKEAPTALAELAVGHRGESWDFSVEGQLSVNRQKDFAFSYDGTNQQDDFNWLQFQIGPTIKFHVQGDDPKSSWAPFIGVHYARAGLSNSSNLRDLTTGDRKDYEHELWGYGGKLGVQWTRKSDSTFLESINYKVFATYTKYRGMEGDYQNGNRISEYDGDPSDNLSDTSINFLVSFSYGDKVFQKLKNKLSSL